jgi:hypothetical protein
MSGFICQVNGMQLKTIIAFCKIKVAAGMIYGNDAVAGIEELFYGGGAEITVGAGDDDGLHNAKF